MSFLSLLPGRETFRLETVFQRHPRDYIDTRPADYFFLRRVSLSLCSLFPRSWNACLLLIEFRVSCASKLRLLILARVSDGDF